MADSQRKRKDRASKAFAEGRFKEALELYREIIREDPAELNVRMKIGEIHRRLGDPRAAIDAYEWVAEAYAQDGLLLKAIAVCKIILSLDPRHTATQSMLADLYARRKKPASAPVAPAQFGGAPLPGASSPPPSTPSTPEIEFEEPAEMELTPAPVQLQTRRLTESAEDVSSDRRDVLQKPLEQRIPGAQTWADEVRIEDLEAVRAAAAARRTPERTEGGPGDDEPLLEEQLPIPELDSRVPEAQPVPARSVRSAPLGSASEGPALPEIPLFSDLPKAAFIELLLHLKHRTVRSGQVIIREGEPGDSFFVVADGQVRVSRANDQGQQVRLARLKDGAFFGEMALLQSGPRTATVVAETDAQILEISREAVEKVISTFPSVATVLRDFHRQRLLATTMATNELFRPFPPEERRKLMEKFKAKSFERGAVLVQEDTSASGLYILLHGRLIVTKMREEEEVHLAELNPGEMFGEMSLLTNDPTSATITAVTDCFVIRLSKRKFQEVMMTHPHVLEVVSKISEERRQDNEHLLAPRLSHHGAILV